MKLPASIFLLLLSFLTIQPLFSSIRPVQKKHCCLKMKMNCPKKQSSNDAGKCDGSKCNPFMACASGNFYNIAMGFTEICCLDKRSEKILPENDNRLSANLSDCWHPPEYLLD